MGGYAAQWYSFTAFFPFNLAYLHIFHVFIAFLVYVYVPDFGVLPAYVFVVFFAYLFRCVILGDIIDVLYVVYFAYILHLAFGDFFLDVVYLFIDDGILLLALLRGCAHLLLCLPFVYSCIYACVHMLARRVAQLPQFTTAINCFKTRHWRRLRCKNSTWSSDNLPSNYGSIRRSLS